MIFIIDPRRACAWDKNDRQSFNLSTLIQVYLPQVQFFRSRFKTIQSCSHLYSYNSQKKAPNRSITATRGFITNGAEGENRTRTTVGHYPLKIACLPVPPLRHIFPFTLLLCLPLLPLVLFRVLHQQQVLVQQRILQPEESPLPILLSAWES